MFYTLDMVQRIGFNSLDDFVNDFVSRHPNSCVRFVPGGVSVNYDFDTEPALACMGYLPVMIVAPTREEVIDIMIANGMNINDAKNYVATLTDDVLQHKAIMDDGTWLDASNGSESYQNSNMCIKFDTIDFDDEKYKGYVFKADYMKNGD